ncbi:MAG TPA: hypothetical protein VJZ78_03120 [Anaerolineales bacterium]|nr:hypothetical protein [Anaerolineales bacterium]
MISIKENIKKIVGEIPLAAEVYWLTRKAEHPTGSNYSLRNVKEVLPEAVSVVAESRKTAPAGKKIFLFSSTHKWLEIDLFLSLALAGQGHEVTHAYYPYGEWNIQSALFDLRKQSVYTRNILSQVSSVMSTVDLFRSKIPSGEIPREVLDIVDQVTDYDYMYAYQTEEVNDEDQFYLFRHDRNLHSARTLYSLLQKLKPDVVIVPNGTILELGVAYRISRLLDIPTSTFEYSDQRNVMWLAQNDEIMLQNTDLVWKKAEGRNLKPSEIKKVESLMTSRKEAALYGKFSRKWQNAPSKGPENTKKMLGLDDRPVILLATNVMGDSLTLGRQTFTKSMADWIIRTIQYFIQTKGIQLVIRIHPGEARVEHGSISEMIQQMLPVLPDHIHVIGPLEEVNTYDLMDLASLGLVYTTTVGLEMALRGIPVVVAGRTHYRNRGFTHDPTSWVNYFKELNALMENLQSFQLTEDQVRLAWKYTYLFFFEYPHPFPWHMAGRAKDFKECTMSSVLSKRGLNKYGRTFELLTFDQKLDQD